MKPNKKKLYSDYLSKLEKELIAENIEWINFILEYMYTIQLTDEERIEIDDILQEATLYTELKDNEYKDEALTQINEFKQEIGL